jgi:inhibitor of cysteine peptidase
MATSTLDQTDSGRTVEVRTGDTIVLRLAENRTTGYQWQIEQIDQEKLDLADDSFVLAPNAAIGTGGVREFRFVVRSAGESVLTLRYCQPWDSEASVIQRFSVRLAVNPQAR